MDEYADNFHKRVYMGRMMAGLTQREAAEKSGLSLYKYRQYETGKQLSGSADLIKLSRAFGVKVEFFLRRTFVSISEVNFDFSK